MIHRTAFIGKAKIGRNCNIWHYVCIRDGAILGNNCTVGDFVHIDENVRIGDNVKIENQAIIYQGVEIKDNVFIGPGVVFTNDKHPTASERPWDMEETIVRHGASIGANSTILPGIVIGEFAVVGAGSVVTKDVPNHTTVVGNPARELNKFEEGVLY
jgi:UDP-2-acetamido-3-amino-2,3-dideoxy-glucuronate N-acetyltransferase